MGVNLNPTTYVQGGLLSDVDVELKEIRWTTYDFNGAAEKASLCARCIFTTLDGDGEEHEQYLSAGSLDRFIPDDDTDGKKLKQVGTAEKMTKGTNWHLFIQSIVDKGGDLTPLQEDISILDGSKFHVVRVPAPKRTGGNIQRRTEREPEVLVVDKVISLPWDKKAGAKGKATASAKPAAQTKQAAAPAAAAATSDDGDDAMTVVSAVSAVLEGGPVTLANLKIKAFREIGKDKSLSNDKKSALAKMITPDFLAESGFAIDGDTVSAGE